MYEYKIRYLKDSKILTKIIQTDDIKNYKLPENTIEVKKRENIYFSLFKKRKITIENKDLVLLFYELNIMLEANLVISDAMDILIQNQQNTKLKEFTKDLKSSLVNLSSVKKTLTNYKIDENIISFLELSQNSSNLKVNIKSLYLMIQENEKVKNDFKKAIRYPLMLLVTLVLSLNLIFYFVIPKFKAVFSENYESLPFATKLLFSLQKFYFENIFYLLLLVVCFVAFFVFMYLTNYSFKYFIQKLLVDKIPFIKGFYSSTQYYKMFLVLDIFMNSNYEFPRALKESKALIRNKYLLDKISLIDNYLKNGKTISYSFKKVKLFDSLVLSLISTAEASNSLKIVLPEIKTIYKNRFKEKINKILIYIEPIFLFFIVGIILWIVLAIFIPIWDMGNIIKS